MIDTSKYYKVTKDNDVISTFSDFKECYKFAKKLCRQYPESYILVKYY